MHPSWVSSSAHSRQTSSSVASFGAQAALQSYSREQELESDMNSGRKQWLKTVVETERGIVEDSAFRGWEPGKTTQF